MSIHSKVAPTHGCVFVLGGPEIPVSPIQNIITINEAISVAKVVLLIDFSNHCNILRCIRCKEKMRSMTFKVPILSLPNHTKRQPTAFQSGLPSSIFWQFSFMDFSPPHIFLVKELQKTVVSKSLKSSN